MRRELGSAFRHGPSLREMREAMIRYIDARGLRGASREIGVSPTGLDSVIRERARPSRATVRKLERWYTRPQRWDTPREVRRWYLRPAGD